jgi:hypothetical protein
MRVGPVAAFLLLHVCDQVRLKIVKPGMITLCLYLCSITNRSTARLVINCGPAWRKSVGNPASAYRRRKPTSAAGAWGTSGCHVTPVTASC